MEKKILVVYVFSKFDEIDRLINFVESYKKYESGIPHTLLICFKLLDKITLNKCRNILKSIIIMNILMKKNNDYEFKTMEKAVKVYSDYLILFN